MLRRAKIGARPSRASGAAAELRTDEDLKIRLFTTSSLDRMIDDYDNYGGREAARRALEQSPIRSIIVDRQGRGAPAPSLIRGPGASCAAWCSIWRRCR